MADQVQAGSSPKPAAQHVNGSEAPLVVPPAPTLKQSFDALAGAHNQPLARGSAAVGMLRSDEAHGVIDAAKELFAPAKAPATMSGTRAFVGNVAQNLVGGGIARAESALGTGSPSVLDLAQMPQRVIENGKAVAQVVSKPSLLGAIPAGFGAADIISTAAAATNLTPQGAAIATAVDVVHRAAADAHTVQRLGSAVTEFVTLQALREPSKLPDDASLGRKTVEQATNVGRWIVRPPAQVVGAAVDLAAELPEAALDEGKGLVSAAKNIGTGVVKGAKGVARFVSRHLSSTKEE